MKTVRQIMTEDVEVISPDATLREAADRMRTRDVGPLPVCDGTRLVGMVTDRDIVVRGIAMGWDPNLAKVSDVMTREVDYCFVGDSLDRAAELMATRQIRRLVVLDDQKNLAGIISLGDLSHVAPAREVARTLEETAEPPPPAHHKAHEHPGH